MQAQAGTPPPAEKAIRMTRAEILAQIELTSRQISDQREGWVAGAKWVLAQLDAPDPQPRLPPEAVMGGSEWADPTSPGTIEDRVDPNADRG